MAIVRLRAFARSHNAKLTEVAARLVNRTLPEADRAELTRREGVPSAAAEDWPS